MIDSPLATECFKFWLREVHGQDPFPWQCRLLEMFREGRWPSSLALPTATGKTTILDIWLFALAMEAAAEAPRTVPMRLAFVVDRRVVVDEAHRRAQRIAAALAAPPGPWAERVAHALRRLSGAEPLTITPLRGGIYREDRWARQPNQPTVLCSTVDQVGSRLLHRGYGLSPSTWPIHAGLLGNDTLIVLDEAHCSAPFLSTLEQIGRLRQRAETALALPWGVIPMTATPREGDEPFSLDGEDTNHPVLAARLERPKPLKLVDGGDKEAGFLSTVSDHAWTLLSAGGTVLVVVNRVASARAVYARLTTAAKGRGAGGTLVVLLTGRSRAVDRDALMRRIEPLIGANPDRTLDSARPGLIVVATQCIEVGADLDSDALVTEICPLDVLRQRLGRLNRLGRLPSAPCVVVASPGFAWKGDGSPPSDVLYGEASARTWCWLRELEAAGPVDGSVAALGDLLADAPDGLNSVVDPGPFVFPIYGELWAQTAPVPAASPDPAPFLHGAARGTAEVQVVWRADLTEEAPETWLDTLSLCPPTAGESLPLPLYAAREWLEGVKKPGPLTDVEGALRDQDDPTGGPAREARAVLCWRGPERSWLARAPAEIEPGDTLVVPSSYGGCDELGWCPGEPTVSDRADRARLAARRAPILRLHPNVLQGQGLDAALTVSATPADEASDDLRDRMELALDELVRLGGELGELARALRDSRKFRVDAHPSGIGWVLTGRAGWASEGRDFSDEDDASSTAPSEVTLTDHLRDVRDVVRTFARSLPIAPSIVSDIALAAWLHDLGKADPRFQAWLYDGSHVKARRGAMLAKSPSLPASRVGLARARERAGYPRGGRHELLSVRLVESAPGLLEAAHDRDLVLHLIESHHGHCRPFAPVVQDPRALQVSFTFDGVPLSSGSATGLERLDSGVAERYFSLTRRYGWWGLSYLEAFLRLADHRASEAAEGGGNP